MKSAKKSVNHLILLLAIISVVNTNCAPIKRNWKSKTKKVTSTPGTPDAAPEKGTPADDSASNNSSEELDETIEVVAGEKPEKRETSGNSGTGDESADSAGSQTQENQLGESQTGEQESGEIDSSDDPVAEGTVDNTNAETAAEASAETGDAIVQSVMKADPILLIAGTPAGDDILKALEYKFEDGFYNLSPATQFLIISLVDETQKLTGGQSPLKLSFESLFSEPIEVAESTLLEMSEIRSLLDEEGISAKYPDLSIREKFAEYAGALDNEIALMVVNENNALARSSLMWGLGTSVVFMVVQPEMVGAVANRVASAVRTVGKGSRSVGLKILPNPVRQRLVSTLARSASKEAQASFLTFEAMETAMALSKGSRSITHKPYVWSRNFLYTVLENVTGKKFVQGIATIKGTGAQALVKGLPGIEAVGVSGKSFAFSWRKIAQRVSVKSLEFKPTANPAVEHAFVAAGNDGGAIFLRVNKEKIVAFYAKDSTRTQSARLLESGLNASAPVESEVAAQNLRLLAKSIEENASSAMSAVAIDSKTGAIRSIFSRVKNSYMGSSRLTRGAIGFAFGFAGSGSRYFFRSFDSSIARKLDDNAVIDILKSEDDFSEVSQSEPAATPAQ